MNCCQANLIFDAHTADNIRPLCGKSVTNLDPIISTNETIEINEYLEKICAKNNIPKSIENEATYLFLKGRKKQEQDVYAAVCLYQAFLNQNMGRFLLEISRLCFVPITKLSQYVTGDIEIKPSDLLERIVYNLNITSYKTKCEIKIFADYLHDNFLRCSPPRSSVDISIVEKVTNPQPSVEIAAQNCDISLSCLQRLRRVYKEEIAAVHRTIANKPVWVKGETYHEPEKEAGGSTRP